MPALHLKRKATVKVLENLKKSIPQLLLSDSIHESLSEKPRQTFAAVASQQVNRPWKGKTDDNRQRSDGIKVPERRERGCYNCAEFNHGVKQCRYDQKLRCPKCHRLGHKMKFCRD